MSNRGHHLFMRLAITGVNLPGRAFCRPDGSSMENVHVGIQINRDPAQLVRADTPNALWEVDIAVVKEAAAVDFRGAAVQGKRGDRFVYLTWGDLDAAGGFEMFRRAKLMLNRIDSRVIDLAIEADRLEATVDLTGPDGGPRCARVDPPAVSWSAPEHA